MKIDSHPCCYRYHLVLSEENFKKIWINMCVFLRHKSLLCNSLLTQYLTFKFCQVIYNIHIDHSEHLKWKKKILEIFCFNHVYVSIGRGYIFFILTKICKNKCLWWQHVFSQVVHDTHLDNRFLLVYIRVSNNADAKSQVLIKYS